MGSPEELVVGIHRVDNRSEQAETAVLGLVAYRTAEPSNNGRRLRLLGDMQALGGSDPHGHLPLAVLHSSPGRVVASIPWEGSGVGVCIVPYLIGNCSEAGADFAVNVYFARETCVQAMEDGAEEWGRLATMSLSCKWPGGTTATLLLREGRLQRLAVRCIPPGNTQVDDVESTMVLRRVDGESPPVSVTGSLWGLCCHSPVPLSPGAYNLDIRMLRPGLVDQPLTVQVWAPQRVELPCSRAQGKARFSR